MKRRSHFINMTGWQCGHIKVLRIVEDCPDGRVRWLGRCVCGDERPYLGGNLRAPGMHSCGCRMKRGHWLPDRERALIALVRQGNGYHIAARELATSRSAISGKVQRLRAEGRI